MIKKLPKALIVDDQQEIIDVLCGSLEEVGMEDIATRTDGAYALAYLKLHGHEIGLMMTDWNMPLVDGLTLIREVRALYPHIYCVMLSSRTDPASREIAQKAGAHLFIAKPFDPEDLEGRIVELLVTGKTTP